MGIRIIPEQKFAYCDRCGIEATKPWLRFTVTANNIQNTNEDGLYTKNLFPSGIELCNTCMLDLVKFMKGQ